MLTLISKVLVVMIKVACVMPHQYALLEILYEIAYLLTNSPL